MKVNIIVAISTLFFLNQQITAGPPTGPPIDEYSESKCVIKEGTGGMIELMKCSPVGHDGRTLGEMLSLAPVFSTADGVSIGGHPSDDFDIPPSALAKGFASSFIPRVKQLHLIIDGGFPITDDCLAGFTNLEYLNTDPRKPQDSPRVSISANAFHHTPNLTQLRLSHYFYFPENTIRALESLKDQVVSLQISDCYPHEEILALASKFSKLTKFYLDLYRRPLCSQNLFQNSAKTLNSIHLSGCNVPRLPAAMLANLSAVTNLRLVHNDITTVEPKAFDQLPNLKGLYMMGNKIERLPDGIFEKNTMLEIVDFAWNGLENLSRGNFTHCPNFKHLVL